MKSIFTIALLLLCGKAWAAGCQEDFMDYVALTKAEESAKRTDEKHKKDLEGFMQIGSPPQFQPLYKDWTIVRDTITFSSGTVRTAFTLTEFVASGRFCAIYGHMWREGYWVSCHGQSCSLCLLCQEP